MRRRNTLYRRELSKARNGAGISYQQLTDSRHPGHEFSPTGLKTPVGCNQNGGYAELQAIARTYVPAWPALFQPLLSHADCGTLELPTL